MSTSLDDLYKQVILEHSRSPRRPGELPSPPAVKAEGYNPLCGDEVTLYIDVEDGIVRDLRTQARGCSISQATASMLSEAVAGKTVAEARALAARFHSLMETADDEGDPSLGDLVALAGVRKFPMRIKCATLPVVAFEQGLDDAAT